MADEEHVNRLQQGVPEWNEWRTAKRPIVNLSHAKLMSATLNDANLSGAHLLAPARSRWAKLPNWKAHRQRCRNRQCAKTTMRRLHRASPLNHFAA